MNKSQDSYQGEYKNGLYHGFGKYIFSNGQIYIGEWKYGKYNGIGTKYFPNGESKSGLWKDNHFIEDIIVKTPWHLVDIWYKVNVTEKIETMSIDFNILNDIPNDCYLFIAPFGLARLNNIDFYAGIQTKSNGYNCVSNINTLCNRKDIGRGVIFSRWGERSTKAIRTAKNGVHESAGYEGDFISVRNHFQWTKGKYQLKLSVTGDKCYINEKEHSWVKLDIKSYSSGSIARAGHLAFPGAELLLGQNMAIFVELYQKDINLNGVPFLKLNVSNLKINKQRHKINSLTAYYPKKYPQWANVAYKHGKAIIEVGSQFDRIGYLESKQSYYKKL